MKEATGELNMTVVTVVALAAVAAFFYAFVWPTLKSNITNSQKCANAICNSCSGNSCTCTYIEGEGTAATAATITCPNKEK